MKILKQFGIILAISFAGDMLSSLLPFPVPGSIYGMVILFILLFAGIIKIESIKETSSFLIEVMPLLFIPPSVALLESWGILKPVFVKFVFISVLSTFLVMAVSGHVTQAVIRLGRHMGSRKEGA